MSEGLGVHLDPSFNLAEFLSPYAKRFMMQRYSPLVWTKRLGRAGFDIAQLSIELPQQLRQIMREIERGNVEISVRPESFDQPLDRVERLANRVVLGVVAAAFINGIAMLLAVYRPPGWDQLAGAVFAVGFIIASTLGLYLARVILRSGHG